MTVGRRTPGSENRPAIAVSSGCWPDLKAARLPLDYPAALEEAGGLPLIVAVPHRLRRGDYRETPAFARAYAEEVLGAVDGLLLTGGPDLDPWYQGEDPLPTLGPVDQPRDTLEMALARAALDRGVPVLGICRGLQVLAVAAGGALHQDLHQDFPGAVKHRQAAARDALTHVVEVRAGTVLAGLVGAGPLRVNSFHHQAVSRVPEGFVVSALAPDGVIEALESVGGSTGGSTGGAAGALPGALPGASPGALPDLPWRLGVQWHPENLWARAPVFLSLFQGLVEAARARPRTPEKEL